ncbi:MAG: hypothetical protein ACREJO_11070 [Phycisphaerales bacterium]
MRHVFGAAVLVAATLVHGASAAQPPSKPAAPAETKPDTSGPPTWMAIPLEGEFGTEVTAAGVVAAMNDAKNRKFGHVVFIVDSPGGRVEDARAIVEVLKPFSATIKCHCVVKKAEGAALWVVAASGTIFVAAKSEPLSFGIAGNDEEAKAERARAADGFADELAKIAGAHGHSPWIFRAIVAPKSELWLVPGDKPALSSSMPAAENARQIDGPDSTLTLNSELAVELRLARSISEPSGDLVGAALGVAPWRSSKNAGAVHMKHAAMELVRLRKNFEASQKKYTESVDEMQRRMERLPAMKEKAAADDPSKSVRVDYAYDLAYRRLMPESSRAWTDQTNKAIDDWQAVQAIVREADSLRKDALRAADSTLRDAQTELKFRRLPVPTDAKPREVPKLNFDPEAEWRNAANQIDKLNRSKGGPR